MSVSEKGSSQKTLIAIPVYNAEKFLRRTIDSCLQQTLPAPIIIVDNQSTDGSRAIAEEYAATHDRVTLVVNEENLGRTGNWNKCLEEFESSPYQYIKFVFTGDTLLPKCIEETEKIFATDEEISAVVFPYEFIDRDGNSSVKHEHPGNILFDKKQTSLENLEKGGVLGAIIGDVYNKEYIKGYRFNELFVGKADFDFEVLFNAKSYYLDTVLAQFYLDGHGTFDSAMDYPLETEFAFVRMRHLKKNRALLTDEEYERIREIILLETVTRSYPYFPVKTHAKLFGIVWLKLCKDILRFINPIRLLRTKK